MRPAHLWTTVVGAALTSMCSGVGTAIAEPVNRYDVVVYGGTSAGVAAAIQVARMGKTVVVVEPGTHLGGLTSGGLGATDIGNKAAIGGISREFYQRIYRHYVEDSAWQHERRDEYFGRLRRRRPEADTMWTFEPHVAEAVFEAMLQEQQVPVVFGERLDLTKRVRKRNRRIGAIVMESGRIFRGRMFVDATYEGDLMALAGVSYTVGREANATYGETLNGVQTARATHHQFNHPIDPYVVPGDPASGLLPRVGAHDPGEDGTGDHRVQAYCFRMCLTDVPENRVPVPKPDGYDPMQYQILLRYLQAGWSQVFGNHKMMPNRKSDTNNHGAFSTDNIGMNYDYPEGDYATRERIVREHESYQKGLMWFLANDPRVPESVQSQVRRWGLPRDEFTDNGHWPHQLYVREARRMVSDYVMTEHNCRGTRVAEDSVGLGAYGMDSHNTQRYVDADGHVRNEGDVQVGGFSPYPISYRSIIPKRGECRNLLVPVCLSASHIAYGSIRMEPVFMIMGQSAATAAVHAMDERATVQNVNYTRLRQRLLDDGQILEWAGPRRPPVRVLDAKALPGVVVDDAEAQFVGDWPSSVVLSPYVNLGYRHDDDSEKGAKTARFQALLSEGGRYEVRLAYSPSDNRATNTPVTVEHAGGSETVRVNQRRPPNLDDAFVSLGVFDFAADRPAVVTITNKGTDGHVIVDAVQFLPVRDQ
ncbi:MAG: FAD-dependent oxidoreductase [Armatimonadota bacterium]